MLSEEVSSKTPKQQISDIITIYSMLAYDKKMKWCDALEGMEKEIHGVVKVLVETLEKRIKIIEEEQNIWYDEEDAGKIMAYKEVLVLPDAEE